MRNKILEKSKTNKQLIGIRLYQEENDFWLGYIEDFNEEIIQLRYFDQFGNEDGIVIEQQSNIDSIDFESEYEKTYEYLVNKKNYLVDIVPIVTFKDSENWRYEYLKEVKNRNELISVQFNDEVIIYGYVIELDGDSLILDTVDQLGQTEGKTVYKIEDITAFKIADKHCKQRQELYTWRVKPVANNS
ncbi:MAG: hypothetical protein RLN79_02380 [Cytophagales bacterium]